MLITLSLFSSLTFQNPTNQSSRFRARDFSGIFADQIGSEIMSEHSEASDGHSTVESVMEKISEKIHGHDSSSSSSSSESESEAVKPEPESSTKAKNFRIFGRERPVHQVFGGGKPADVLLWRNKKISASFLGGVTGAWVFFELLEYHLLTLVCHILIVALVLLFLWSNAHTFLHKSPPKVPEVKIPEDPFLQVVSALTLEINHGFAVLHSIASGRNLKKFLIIIAGLWVLSIVGSWCNFLTLFYIVVVLLHTVPVLYEKYEDKIDPVAEKALIEFKKYYAVFDEKVLSKVLSKIPKGLKDKKKA